MKRLLKRSTGGGGLGNRSETVAAGQAGATVATVPNPYGAGAVFSLLSGGATFDLAAATGVLTLDAGVSLADGAVAVAKVRVRDAGDTRASEATYMVTGAVPPPNVVVVEVTVARGATQALSLPVLPGSGPIDVSGVSGRPYTLRHPAGI